MSLHKRNCFISILQNSLEKNRPRKSSGSIINLVWGRDWKLEFDLLRWGRSWVRVSEGCWSEGVEEQRHFVFVIRPSSWVQCVFFQTFCLFPVLIRKWGYSNSTGQICLTASFFVMCYVPAMCVICFTQKEVCSLQTGELSPTWFSLCCGENNQLIIGLVTILSFNAIKYKIIGRY